MQHCSNLQYWSRVTVTTLTLVVTMNAAAVDMLVGGLLCAAVRAPLVLSARNTRTLITVFTRTSWGPLANGGQGHGPVLLGWHETIAGWWPLLSWKIKTKA